MFHKTYNKNKINPIRKGRMTWFKKDIDSKGIFSKVIALKEIPRYHINSMKNPKQIKFNKYTKSSDLSILNLNPIGMLLGVLFAFYTLMGLIYFIGEGIEVIKVLKATEAAQTALIEELLLKVQNLEGEISQLKIEVAQQQKLHGKIIEDLSETTEDLKDSRDILFINYVTLRLLKIFKVI